MEYTPWYILKFYKKNKSITFIFFFILLINIFTFQPTFADPIEKIIGLRKSTHASGSYTNQNITEHQILEILNTAYGYTKNGGRSISRIGGNYSLDIYLTNSTGSYIYLPNNNSILLYDITITKETIKPHNQGWPSEASYVLIIIWNQTKMDNFYFATAEAGCLVQNIYLKAAELKLGTCCVGSINSNGLRNDLSLSANMTPLLVMPLGYPLTPYQDATPNFDVMNGNLPSVKYGNMSLDDTINNRISMLEWSLQYISLQDISQLLWAAYGSSNTTHRTTPSAHGVYPLIIYVLNSSGVYEYIPEINQNEYSHYLEKMLDEDKKFEVMDSINQTWAADAPAILLIAFDSLKGGDWGGPFSNHEFIEIDSGCVIQNIFLEATVWDLETSIIKDVAEEWNGTRALEIRNVLNLDSNIIPLYLMPLGYQIENNAYFILASANVGGSISPSGEAAVNEGDNQTFTISPDVGYHILDVLVGRSSVGVVNSYTFINVTANHTIAAAFTQDQYTLKVNTVGNGSVALNPNQATYVYGEEVQLTATADLGWAFTTWSGDLMGSTNPNKITMDRNKNITATFTQDQDEFALYSRALGIIIILFLILYSFIKRK